MPDAMLTRDLRRTLLALEQFQHHLELELRTVLPALAAHGVPLLLTRTVYVVVPALSRFGGSLQYPEQFRQACMHPSSSPSIAARLPFER